MEEKAGGNLVAAAGNGFSCRLSHRSRRSFPRDATARSGRRGNGALALRRLKPSQPTDQTPLAGLRLREVLAALAQPLMMPPTSPTFLSITPTGLNSRERKPVGRLETARSP
jgi:hypothetical protein